VQTRRLGTIDYEQALAVQRDVHEQRVAGENEDTLLLLEHPSVYTAGRRTLPEERPFDGTPVLDVDRGGKITWHGPGQLVGYPIVALPDPIDVVAYVRLLETALIGACAQLGVEAGTVEGRSGVWTPDGQRKLAAIGIRVSRGVTMHGFAINCDPDLTAYDRIVACGIRNASVTSLSVESGKHISVADAVDVVQHCVVDELIKLTAAVPAVPVGASA
jgi:lipoyl(octanoyl) transferase